MLIYLSIVILLLGLTAYLVDQRLLFSPCFLTHAVLLRSPGDTVLLSCLTNRHGQNESSSVLPKARLCPRGGLPGRISMRPVGSVYTDCDRNGAPLAPHTIELCSPACTDGHDQWSGWHMPTAAREILQHGEINPSCKPAPFKESPAALPRQGSQSWLAP